MFRELKDTNGRYIISETGIVLDTRPYSSPNEETWYEDSVGKPREIRLNGDKFVYVRNGKQVKTKVHLTLMETFPELYTLSDEERRRITDAFKDERQDTYKINIKDFNRIIFPNRLIKIYDTTCNDEKRNNGERPDRPAVITADENGDITFKKGRKYFGYGTLNIIHFSREEGLPYNTKPWAENEDYRYKNKKEKSEIQEE